MACVKVWHSILGSHVSTGCAGCRRPRGDGELMGRGKQPFCAKESQVPFQAVVSLRPGPLCKSPCVWVP